ncbi:MAG: dihydroorotate dehydrogenase (quinone) [Rhodovulum sulfidophilum]|uniref:Dihydroorotate dehydrogenase (quinone) n=1 Tax=Rhodovulum sulfidophilum TaxID=35806 RepID=A0A2W5N660_RHOSU|nr:MAG: dihydroorotate dehydrogenase (quinone) [Rhodovulum sulfidophilum]
MRLIDRLGMPLLRGAFDPETAHGLALAALNAGLGPRSGPPTSPRLATRIAGLDLPNPVGLAAGFDKNATALAPLARAGFGFLEVGAATPLPQPGNPKPRLFRLDADQAAINRFGFNNDGAEAIAARLARRPAGMVTGLNLGANKTSADRAADFARVLTLAGPHVDFATVNVSSPNTEKLRDLQGRAALDALLGGVMAANADLARPVPIFLKIAPDLTDAELAEICEVAEARGVAALIATNTTLSRDGLTDPRKAEAGGLSGRPLFRRSTRILARAALLTGGRLPLIGAGGIASAEDAYAKIRAGASATQFYTAMVFGGIGLAAQIARGLDALLARDGVASLSDVVGVDAGLWASGSDM